MTAQFEIPNPLKADRDFGEEYGLMLQHVNEVNHGEFEEAAELVIEQSNFIEDQTPERPTAVAIQRCRRGGKTFMLHAVAALLQDKANRGEHCSRVIYISLNSDTAFDPRQETAYGAITSRLAWELSAREGNFRRFRAKYSPCHASH